MAKALKTTKAARGAGLITPMEAEGMMNVAAQTGNYRPGAFARQPLITEEQFLANPSMKAYEMADPAAGSYLRNLWAKTPAAQPGYNGSLASSVALPEAAAPAAAAAEGGGAGLLGKAGAFLRGPVGKALPFVGDVAQGIGYGMEGEGSALNKIGRGTAAALGSFGGRVTGAIAGAPLGGLGSIPGEIAGSAGGAYGAAKLYDAVTGGGHPQQAAPSRPAQARGFSVGDINVGNPGAGKAPIQSPAEPLRVGDITVGNPGAGRPQLPSDSFKVGDITVGYPNGNAPAPTGDAIKAGAMSVEKPAPGGLADGPSPAPKAEFTGPTQEEMAAFRKQTGTRFNPLSVNDKLSLERMRAGEETFDSRQANEWRKAHQGYRPGMYSQLRG